MLKSYPFWFFVLVLICFHLFAYTGHYGYDDLFYAKLAKQFLDGQIDYYDHYSYRWTTIIYTALFFKVFGVGDFAIACSALSISIATLFISFLLLRHQKPATVFFSLSLQVLGSWYLFYSDKLTPDIYVLLFATLSIYFLVKQKFGSAKPITILNAFGLSIALFLGFLSKETILLLAPPLLFFAISDWVQKKNRIFWYMTAAFGILFLAIYFYFIQVLTGDVMARFSAIQANAYYNLCSYDVQAFIFTLRRIGYQFIELFIQTGLAIPLAFLLSAISRKPVSFWKPQSERDFYIVLSLLILISGNFMSTSIKAYSPICLDIRHFLWMMPVLAIMAGLGLKNYLEKEESDFSITRWLIVICIASWYFGSSFTFTLYLPFTLVWLLHGFYRNTWFKKYFILVLLLTQLYPVYHWVNYAQGLRYEKQKEDINKLSSAYPNETIITDEVQRNLLRFYQQFDSGSYNKVLIFEEIIGNSYVNKIIYKNWYTQYLSGMQEQDLPLWMRLESLKKTGLFRDTILGIEAFKIHDSLSAKTLFKNTFGYEGKSEYRDVNKAQIVQKNAFAGSFSEQQQEYSSSFILPLDSIHLSGKGEFMIKATVQCKMKDRTDLKLIIDISNKEKNLFWAGADANQYMKAYGLWWPVTHEVILNQADYANKHATLKIYLLMDKKPTEAFIDNWAIEVKEY
ncbi:MAG: glycosyltransferase family 39 protein [Bacteroidota bacterium]|nr:glycosyltransferase family 39 protein [Bacteroidota bacterium]